MQRLPQRLTQRNYFGKAFVPGYAPKITDKATCELLCKATERLAAFEDLLEYPGILDSLHPEAIEQLKEKGII